MRDYERKFHARCQWINDYECPLANANTQLMPYDEEPLTGTPAIWVLVNVSLITFCVVLLCKPGLREWWNQ